MIPLVCTTRLNTFDCSSIMIRYPDTLFQQLGFDKIVADLVQRCAGQPGRERMAQPAFMHESAAIDQKLKEIVEFQRLTSLSPDWQVPVYLDLSKAFLWLTKQDSVLDAEDIVEIKNQIQTHARWHEGFTTELRKNFDALYQVIDGTRPRPELQKKIDRILNDDGTVKDSASEALRKIRRELLHVTNQIDQAFSRALVVCRDKGYLTDNYETYRNGRRVLAVAAEHKRKVKGVIHDESATGRTVFIQPEETLLLDNQLMDWQNEERREIRLILRDLTRELSAFLPELRQIHEAIVAVDLIQSKARQGADLGVVSRPQSTDQSCLQWYKACHPLLLLRHKHHRDHVVPFDLTLDEHTQIVVISGPNAGGKSIALKATGLICMMHQSAMLTPVDDRSTMGTFHQILTDIGDQQSIEEDLSTYSSHLKHMKTFSEQADDRTLFLIDELGSGTEPTLGAAIAESLLLTLHESGAKGIVTTHYGNLKMLANKVAGMINASMAFDKEALMPTYQMQMGLPGSSFAFEMARRSGLSKEIVQRARRLVGRKEGQVENLITGLQKDKTHLEKQLRELEKERKNLDRLIKNYGQLSSDLEVRRKRWQYEEKMSKLQEATRTNQEVEKLIREIRETQNLEKAQQLSAAIKAEKASLQRESEQLKEKTQAPAKHSDRKQKSTLSIGDFVRIKMGGVTGEIQHIDKDKLTVLAGMMTFNVRLDDVDPANEPIQIRKGRSVQTDLQETARVSHRIDLRGLRREEAMMSLEKFLDKAFSTRLSQLEIIHGKGNGVLKKMVKDKVREYKVPCQISHPEPEQGGDGVSLIHIN